MMTPNLAAFAQVIRACEGTAGPDGYRTLFGGSLFELGDDHPRIKITAGGYTSTAAGAFQILAGTWDDFVGAAGPHAFDEAGQNAAFEWLIDRRGARNAIERGDLATAIHLCCREWASLPGSPYGQPTRSMAYCETVWARALDDFTLKPDAAISQPIEPPQPATQEEPSMPAPLLLLLPTIISALAEQLPLLAKAFGPKGEKVATQVTAATTAVNAIAQAVGAVNGEDALTKITADPTLRQAANAALLKEPTFAALIEIGGGVAAARESDARNVAATENWAFVKRSAVFWMSMALLPLAAWYVGSTIVGGVAIPAEWPWYAQLPLKLFGVAWSPDARSGIANLVLGLVLGGICGVYFGVSVTQGRANDGTMK